jgi:hypothetical protein
VPCTYFTQCAVFWYYIWYSSPSDSRKVSFILVRYALKLNSTNKFQCGGNLTSNSTEIRKVDWKIKYSILCSPYAQKKRTLSCTNLVQWSVICLHKGIKEDVLTNTTGFSCHKMGQTVQCCQDFLSEETSDLFCFPQFTHSRSMSPRNEQVAKRHYVGLNIQLSIEIASSTS